MSNLISRISRIGLDPDSPFLLRNKLKVFNIAMLCILLISCFYAVTAILHNYVLSSYVTAYSIASSLFVLFLVHKRKYTFAFHFAMWYGFIFLTAFSLIFGKVTNSYLYFLFLPIACNILFDEKRTIILYVVAIILITLANFIVMEKIQPYYQVSDQELWLGYPNIPFTLVLIFLAVKMFKNENRKYAVQIEEQRAILEQKNEEITDSINYAKRIQSALMAPAVLMQKNLPDHFVLYKPKDIVSGDFYFAAEGEDGDFWLCVGDCTGHGVPGAFMSLLNISILRESIVDQKIKRPDEVLNRQRDAIVTALNPDGALESGKDGMDCALLCFNRETNKLYFSLANNPLLIVRNNELIEFKPDKQPVGLHENVTSPFTLREWKLEKNDIVYAFTDGFADQFGGERGKKFKYARLKESLVENSALTMTQQSEGLNSTFNTWKGELEQVDDVLVIGIRI